jgi:hypothetical protein
MVSTVVSVMLINTQQDIVFVKDNDRILCHALLSVAPHVIVPTHMERRHYD